MFLTILKAELRNIARDRMYTFFVFYPVIFGIGGFYLVKWIEEAHPTSGWDAITAMMLIIITGFLFGAIIAFTQGLAFELAKNNINVNCICPGITDNSGVWTKVSADYIKNMNASREEIVKTFTSKVPLGRLANLSDVSNLTCFLCSDASEYMTGQAVNVTGGREMH